MNTLAPRRCPATTAAGEPCRARPNTSGYCIAHDPAVSAEEKLDRSRRGGQHAKLKTLPVDAPMPDFRTEQTLRETLERTAAAVQRGDLAVSAGNSVIYAASIGLRLAELRLSAEVSRLEDLLARLEREERR